jgi:hypothetical protein
VHCALRVINMVLMRDLWNFSFFGRGDVSPTHSEICRFVSGLWAKHQVSSPVIILLKKTVCIGHRDNVFARCDSIFPLLRCQGVWNRTCTQLSLPKSSFRIRRTTVLGMFKDSAIILDAIRRSILTKPATAAMFTSVRVDSGWPPLSSSSTGSLPSRNREYHLKTFDRSDPHSHKPFAPILVFLSLWNKIL